MEIDEGGNDFHELYNESKLTDPIKAVEVGPSIH